MIGVIGVIGVISVIGAIVITPILLITLIALISSSHLIQPLSALFLPLCLLLLFEAVGGAHRLLGVG